jgi:hypothetical protein
MKNIQIQRVENGWIVSSGHSHQDLGGGIGYAFQPKMWAYQTIEQLQSDIPKLLETELVKPNVSEIVTFK